MRMTIKVPPNLRMRPLRGRRKKKDGGLCRLAELFQPSGKLLHVRGEDAFRYPHGILMAITQRVEGGYSLYIDSIWGA